MHRHVTFWASAGAECEPANVNGADATKSAAHRSTRNQLSIRRLNRRDTTSVYLLERTHWEELAPYRYPDLHMSEVQVIALGGVGEIGKNCSVVREGDDIVVIDCGLSFPTEEMLGIDIVVPDFTYLLQNQDHVRGIFITHAHEDHVGGLPYLMRDLNVPIYCTEFTQALIRQRLEEKLPHKTTGLSHFQAGRHHRGGEAGPSSPSG